MNQSLIKRLIVPCVALLYCINASAQMPQLVQTKNADSYLTLADSFVKLVPGSFTVSEIDSSGTFYKISYKTADDKTLMIGVKSSMRDGNEDLNKPYTKYYTITFINSDYQTLFPVWKKYFQQDAELEKLATDQHGKVQIYNVDEKKKFVLAFVKDAKHWSLIVNEQ